MDSSLQAHREALLRALLPMAAVFGSGALALAILGFDDVRLRVAAIALVGPPVVLLWVASARPSWSFRLRAAILIGSFLLSGSFGFAIVGFHGNGSVVMLSAIAFAALLYGRRGALVVTGMATAIAAMAGAAMVGGVLSPPPPAAVSLVRAMPWARTSAIVAVLGTMVALAIARIVRDVEAALRSSRSHLAALEVAHERRERAERLLDAIVDNTPALIYVKDADLRLVLANAPLCRMFGRAPSEVLGKRSRDLFPEPIATEHEANDRVVLEGGAPIVREEWAPNGDGPHPYLSVKFPLRDARGATYAVAGISTDIRERKAAEEALASERTFVNAVLDTIGALVVVLDRHARIVRFNEACEQATGYAASEVVGQSFIDLLLEPEEVAPVGQVFERLRSGDFPLRHENCWRTKSGGRRRIVWTNTVLCDDAGAVTHVIGTGIDVTRQRELEVRLVSAQRLESLGRLAGSIAHDFNNLLSPILLCSDVLAGAVSDVEGRSALTTLKDAASRARGLTRQLLAFGRGQVLAMQEVDLNEVVTKARAILTTVVGSAVQVDVTLAARRATVLADESQLGQVLLNLVTNAAHAMRGTGDLRVETADVVLGEREVAEAEGARAGAWVRLSVRDTGGGMSAETRTRIFEPFFTTKGADEGTGLGLATVHGIVMQHGGFVTVESAVGQGTTFHVHLPPAGASRQAWAAPDGIERRALRPTSNIEP